MSVETVADLMAKCIVSKDFIDNVAKTILENDLQIRYVEIDNHVFFIEHIKCQRKNDSSDTATLPMSNINAAKLKTALRKMKIDRLEDA